LNSPSHTAERRLLIGAAAATCIANISWWMQPQIVNDVLTNLHTSESAAGFVVTAEFAVMAFTSFAIARLGRGTSYFAISVLGAVFALAGATLTLASGGYPLLIGARALTGLGEGAALMVSTAAVAHLSNPDRAYAQLNIVNICLGAAMSLALPALSEHYGAAALSFKVLFGVMLVLVAISLVTPRAERYAPPAPVAAGGGVSMRVIAVALAVFLVAVASSAMWSFYVVLGLRTGMSAEAVDQSIAYAVLSALPAGILATFVGTRFGRFNAAAVAVAVIVVAIFLITYTKDATSFRIGTCVNVAGIYFLIPYFFGFAAAEDASGRAAAIAGGAFLLTGAAGPYLGGSLMEYLGVSATPWVMLVTDAVALALFLWLERTRTGAHAGSGATALAEASP